MFWGHGAIRHRPPVSLRKPFITRTAQCLEVCLGLSRRCWAAIWAMITLNYGAISHLDEAIGKILRKDVRTQFAVAQPEPMLSTAGSTR